MHTFDNSNQVVSDLDLSDDYDDIDDARPSKRPRTSRGNFNSKKRKCTNTSGVRQNNLVPKLQSFLEEQKFCDAKLVVEGREITCHSLLLAASSPYFEAMFGSSFIESVERRIEIKEYSYQTVEMIINYAYGVTLNINNENAEELLKAADYFQMINLRNECEKFLVRSVDAANCLRLIRFSRIRSLSKLERCARRFSLDKFQLVSQHDEYLELPLTDLVEYLSNDCLCVQREEYVFEAVVRWLSKNGDPDKNYCEALGCVRYNYVTSSYLYNVIQENTMFKDHAGAQRIFQEACRLNALGFNSSMGDTSLFITRPRASAGISSVVVMVGGICNNAKLTNTDCFDYNTQSWKTLQHISTPHGSMHSYSVCTSDNNIYVTGGHSDEGTTLDYASVYLSNIDQWNNLTKMKHPRERHGSAALDGCVYVAGGLLASQKDRKKPGVLNLVERYSFKNNKWDWVKPLPKRCYSPGVVSYKEKLYIIGGVSIDEDSRTFKTVLDVVQCFDPIENRWTVRPLGMALARLSCVHYRDRFYMISNNKNSIFCYDPHTCAIEQWYELPGNNVEFAGLQVHNDNLVLSGGQQDGCTLSSMLTISLDTKHLVHNTPMNQPRCMHGCVVINKFS